MVTQVNDDLWEWERTDLIRELRRLRSEQEALELRYTKLLREQAADVERLHREWADALASLNAKLALVLASDGVGAEEEDQNQSGGDDRQHDVLPGESHDEPPSRR